MVETAPVMRSRIQSKGISAHEGLQCSQDSINFSASCTFDDSSEQQFSALQIWDRRNRGSHRYSRREFLSLRSLIFACSTVCHCMFDGASAPPHSSGTIWSTT